MHSPLELHQAYKRTFSHPSGETVLDDLMQRGMADVPTFAPDPIRMAFNEGRRSMTLHIRHMLDHEHFEPTKE